MISVNKILYESNSGLDKLDPETRDKLEKIKIILKKEKDKTPLTDEELKIKKEMSKNGKMLALGSVLGLSTVAMLARLFRDD